MCEARCAAAAREQRCGPAERADAAPFGANEKQKEEAISQGGTDLLDKKRALHHSATTKSQLLTSRDDRVRPDAASVPLAEICKLHSFSAAVVQLIFF